MGKREASRLGYFESGRRCHRESVLRDQASREHILSIRPILTDPAEEFLLELPVARRAYAIVTYNIRHFSASSQLGIPAMRPGEFLAIIEGRTV